MGPAFIGLTVAQLMVATPAPTEGTALELRLSLGGEWDTNALRTVTGTEQGDGVARLVLDADGQLGIARGHVLRAGYLLGAKRFVGETTEDLLIQSLSLSSSHQLTEWLSGALWGALVANRVRDGQRDYSLGSGGVSIALHPLESIDIRLSGGWQRFVSEPVQNYSFQEPELSVAVAWRPIDGLSLTLRAERAFRDYDGNALVAGTVAIIPNTDQTPANAIWDEVRGVWVDPDDPNTVYAERQIPTFCNESEADKQRLKLRCQPAAREDTEYGVALGARYRGSRVILGAEYLLRAQRSTSDFENIDRHRISAVATFRLPLELVASLIGSLQFNNGVSVTDSLLLAEDDENQNSLQVQLSRALTDALSIEARYGLFAYQFTSVDEGFLRQTVYLGLSYQVDG